MDSILNEYTIKGIIGKGTFSIVKLGIDKLTGEKVAIKILDKKRIMTKDDIERIEREINILKTISHINLIKIKKIKEDSENYYIIMEYCEIGELFNYIVKKRKLDENESSYYYFQIINGLEYIHFKNISHRDLKPENILITDQNILKIIDFGLSNYNKSDELLSTPCGSPCYASPEMIGGKQYDGNLVDIWSTGIILFVMLCGRLPFEGENNAILFRNIVQCKVQYPNFLSDISIDLLKKILVPNPKNRITLSEIKMHPFYLKGKEVFKKINPFIFEKLEKEFKLKNIKDKFNESLNFDYSNIINKTEGNERSELRLNTRSMNLENRLLKMNVVTNKRELITNSNNTPDENNNIFNFKKFNTLKEKKTEINNKYFLNSKKDLNNYEKFYYLRNNNTNILNNEKIFVKKNRPQLKNYENYKENEKSFKDGYYLKENYTPNKKINIFHSLDNDQSIVTFNNSKNNKYERQLNDIFKITQNYINSQENKKERNHSKNYKKLSTK